MRDAERRRRADEHAGQIISNPENHRRPHWSLSGTLATLVPNVQWPIGGTLIAQFANSAAIPTTSPRGARVMSCRSPLGKSVLAHRS
jgi:hypothetical protein